MQGHVEAAMPILMRELQQQEVPPAARTLIAVAQCMADALCRTHELPEDRPFGQCAKACRETVQQLITEWPLTITGSDGFRRAMVTSGGIALTDIHPKTLESRLAPGIYFAGEMLDVDGPCGGFNLQWAFSSGWLAGASAASRHKHEG